MTLRLTLLICFMNLSLFAQTDDDAFFVKEIYDYTLENSLCYDWLTILSEVIGGRLSGSFAAETSVKYTYHIMSSLALDAVSKQECSVPVWQRGDYEMVKVIDDTSGNEFVLNATTLGNSLGTNEIGVKAPIVEVHSLDELKELGEDEIKGKIVFFNRPMNNTYVNTFRAYGSAVDQRASGPSVASKLGAVGTIVRSMTTKLDDIPHTGVTVFEPDDNMIPAMAISTNDAEKLASMLPNPSISLYMQNSARILENQLSHNVIGEITGSQYPDEIILVGGHLDSWDIGGGAHDDGAGCVHALQVMATLKALNYKPKRTIRCVMFMNEENGLSGGKTYADKSNQNSEYHMAAIESDAGGFSPRGFGVGGTADAIKTKFPNVREWMDILSPYGIGISPGGGGADINPLKSQGGLLFGLRPDSQRYFDYHHTALDKIAAVNKRELSLGAAAMTSLVFLLDKYGLGTR